MESGELAAFVEHLRASYAARAAGDGRGAARPSRRHRQLAEAARRLFLLARAAGRRRRGETPRRPPARPAPVSCPGSACSTSAASALPAPQLSRITPCRTSTRASRASGGPSSSEYGPGTRRNARSSARARKRAARKASRHSPPSRRGRSSRSCQSIAPALFLLASALARSGRGDEAIAALRTTVELDSASSGGLAPARRHLVRDRRLRGRRCRLCQALRASTTHPGLQRAALAMVRNDIPSAEPLLKAHLMKAPTDVPAIRMLAEVAMRIGRDDDAKNLLERCLELAPGFAPARYALAIVLHRRNDPERALAEVERLLAADPRNPAYRNLCAVILSRVGEYARSSRMYARAPRRVPEQRQGLAQLRPRAEDRGPPGRKHRRLPQEHRARSHLRRGVLEPRQPQDLPLRAGGPRGDAPRARRPEVDDAEPRAPPFRARQGLRGRGRTMRRPSSTTRRAMRCTARATHTTRTRTPRGPAGSHPFSRASFSPKRAGSGCPAPDPIFIVGMPRSGSTLLEQILSSHSAIEGTTELPELITMARELRDQSEADDIGSYADVLAGMVIAGAAGTRRTLPRAHPHPPQDGPAALHRQDAEQLPARGDDPARAAEREDHRCPPASDGLLLLELQAALRPWPAIQL